MKLRILNIISCLFITACIVSSCLKKEEYEYELSPNASITSFSINDIITRYTKVINGKDSILQDTIFAEDYPFSIDQQRAVIFNADSLPMGTDISKVKVNIKADTYGIYIEASVDSIWEEEDSLNFTYPIQFKVLAETGAFGRIYVAKINVHQQNPDSMVWRKISTNFPTNIEEQKAVYANNQIFVFANQESQVAVSMMNNENNEWTNLQSIDIPVKADYSSVMVWDNQFYILADNQLYTSGNGLNWNKVETTQTFNQLTASMSLEAGKKLIGVNTENQYIESKDGVNWESYGTIPEDFPTHNISYAAYPLATNSTMSRIVVMGDHKNTQNNYTPIWTQLGTEQDWITLSFDSNLYKCPNLENSSLIYYNDQLYVFGGPNKSNPESNAFDYFYSSIDNGITWEKKTENVMFPENFTQLYQQANGNYSCVIDQNNFLWVMWSQTGEVWRGKINKLGFDKK